MAFTDSLIGTNSRDGPRVKITRLTFKLHVNIVLKYVHTRTQLLFVIKVISLHTAFAIM